MTENQAAMSRRRILPVGEIVNGVFLLDTLAAGTAGFVAAYLVKGEESALIDAGYPTSAKAVLSQLRELDGRHRNVNYLIPTHVHLDHAGAVGHLARAMPNARILVSKHGAKHMINPSRLVESATKAFGQEAMSVFGTPIPVARDRVEPVGDKYDLDLGAGKKLKIFSTPGHAPHHMSVLLGHEHLLVTGDAVGLRYQGFDFPIPTTPPPSFDEEQYMRTLTRIIDINPSGLLLPHFGPILSGAEGFQRKNVEAVTHWGSKVYDAVKGQQSIDQVFKYLITDLAEHSGKPESDLPDHIRRIVKLSDMGYYSYIEKRIASQSSLTENWTDLIPHG